jgi:hypothetical protein
MSNTSPWTRIVRSMLRLKPEEDIPQGITRKCVAADNLCASAGGVLRSRQIIALIVMSEGETK